MFLRLFVGFGPDEVEKERRGHYGGYPSGKTEKLHRDVKLSSARREPEPQGKRAAVDDAVPARGLDLFCGGPGLPLQGRTGRGSVRLDGDGGRRVHGSGPGKGRAGQVARGGVCDL